MREISGHDFMANSCQSGNQKGDEGCERRYVSQFDSISSSTTFFAPNETYEQRLNYHGYKNDIHTDIV